MEDSDIVSNFSSIGDAPDHLNTEYDHLGEVFKAHPHLLPSPKTPESNSDAMIKALKALQEKIRRLEVERVSAADRLNHLESKMWQTRKRRQDPTTSMSTGVGTTGLVPPAQTTAQPVGSRQLAQDQEDLQRRLETIDRKFSQQAQELRDMREQFDKCSKSPPGYDTVNTSTLRTPHEKGTPSSPGRFPGSSREREYLSESPVQTRVPHKRKKTRSAQKTYHKKQAGGLHLCQLAGGRPQPGVHYRLDMKDVPFVAGTSLSPSHSVAANYQRVISLMKAHNPLLCGAAAASSSRKLKKQRCATAAGKTGCPIPPAVTLAELQVLLAGLEEELGELTFKHQQLALKAASQPDKIRAELQHLVDDLGQKAMQIDIVRRQIDSKSSRKAVKRSVSAPRKVKRKQSQDTAYHEEHVGVEARVDLLHRMKSLQKTLQSDDLTWK